MKTEDIDDQRFIAELAIWYLKGHKPLAKISILNTDDDRNLLAILCYTELDKLLVLSDKSYANYQQSFQKLGALFDKTDL